MGHDLPDADVHLCDRAADAADPDNVLALARLLMDQRRWEDARAFALELVRLVPTAPGPQRLLNELQVLELRSRR